MLESNLSVLNTAEEDAARIAVLEGELAQLRRRDAERSAELDARERRIRVLEEALRILQSHRFGSSREKLHVAPGQAELFNEAETVAELNEVLGCKISRNGPARFRVNGPTLNGLPAEPRFESSTRPFSLKQVFGL